MESFRVIESGEGIERRILRTLSARGGARTQCVSEGHPALLVISPRAARRGLELPNACRILLVPGDAGKALGGLRAASAVSYGVSPRDSLTISSQEKDRLWAALQREVVTLDGQVVDRQEFLLDRTPGAGPLSTLAAAGALLLLGVLPEELSRFSENI